MVVRMPAHGFGTGPIKVPNSIGNKNEPGHNDKDEQGRADCRQPGDPGKRGKGP
jgi:hypothetical protein